MSYCLSSLGIVSALGHGARQTIEQLLNVKSQTLTFTNEFTAGHQPIPVGQVHMALPSIVSADREHISRNNQMLLAAYQQIEQAVSSAIDKYGKHRTGIVLGTSTSGIAEGERSFRHQIEHGEWPENYHYGQQDIGAPALFLADYLGLRGIAYTISTACSSGAKAMASASRLLSMDMCDVVICGGVDTLCDLTIRGFSALDAMSNEICNPCSKNRCGINIGEGAALFLLEREGDNVRLSGAGETSDAHHISAPDPEGGGAYRAMALALQQASRSATDIDYINLPGTATVHNDAMESKAINDLLGPAVLCSSTKPLTGHCLGASGAIEAGLCWLLLQSDNKRLPIHRWDGQRDENLADISLTNSGNCEVSGLKCILSNSFAFGGSNISLLLERDTIDERTT